MYHSLLVHKATFVIFTTVLLNIIVFRNVTLCLWASCSRFEDDSVFIFGISKSKIKAFLTPNMKKLRPLHVGNYSSSDTASLPMRLEQSTCM